MSVGLVRTVWAGTTGGQGLTQIAFSDATGSALSGTECQAAVNAVRAFWDACKGFLPNEVTLTVLPTVDEYQTGTTGNALIASHTVGTAPATVTGTDAGSYAMAAGLKANLQTNVIANGRRVRGAIYLVPCGVTAYNTSGMVGSGAKTAIDAAGATLMTAMNTAGCDLNVWSRGRTLPTARNGITRIVSAVKTNDQTAILRGRRD
jgi:hypothetical protein